MNHHLKEHVVVSIRSPLVEAKFFQRPILPVKVRLTYQNTYGVRGDSIHLHALNDDYPLHDRGGFRLNPLLERLKSGGERKLQAADIFLPIEYGQAERMPLIEALGPGRSAAW